MLYYYINLFMKHSFYVM